MKDKVFPVLFESEEDCCACSACAESCPKKSIAMKINSSGFEYPIINKNTCICCYKCLKVCPLKNYKPTLKTKSGI